MLKNVLSLTIMLTMLMTSAFADQNKSGSLNISDLGFKAQETKPNLELQATLEKRSSMLHTHQTLGLITGGLMLTSLLTSGGGQNKNSWLHPALGAATALSYGTTAYFSIFAPKPDNIQDVGTIKLHKILAWIHGPVMAALIVSGFMARTQIDHGEPLHGLAKYKPDLAVAELASFFPALAIMVFDINL